MVDHESRDANRHRAGPSYPDPLAERSPAVTRALILALLLASCAADRTDNNAAYWGAASKAVGQTIRK